jgi:hypothetical protein
MTNLGRVQMTENIKSNIFLVGVLVAPLAFVACGGGGDGPSACTNPNPAVCAAVGSASSGSPSPTTTAATAAFHTTSPSAVTLNAGSSATYTVAGGVAPYTATSANTNVAIATISGSTLSISGMAAGTAPLAIVDASGKTLSIIVTTLAQGQAGSVLSLSPASLTVGDCTTNIPFIFTGGVAPFTIYTSDNFSVPVSSPLPLGKNSYFTATIKALNPTNIISPAPSPYTATLTVLDSNSQKAEALINVPVVHVACLGNPLLQISPESANFRASEILSFQIAGGPTPAEKPTVVVDPSVATVVSVTPTSINVQAAPFVTTTVSTLMTITAKDGQKANVVITVFPQP